MGKALVRSSVKDLSNFHLETIKYIMKHSRTFPRNPRKRIHLLNLKRLENIKIGGKRGSSHDLQGRITMDGQWLESFPRSLCVLRRLKGFIVVECRWGMTRNGLTIGICRLSCRYALNAFPAFFPPL